VIFHNQSLLKMVGVQTEAELHALVEKPLFKSEEINRSISLLNAT